jgi:GNAT superfamily N-acetyltransferase
MSAERLHYRRATPADTRACHDLMWASVVELGSRHGSPLSGTADEWWSSSEPIHRLLARLAAEWWVAEESDSGRLLGFARTLERDGLFELTEFFVLPDAQGKGIGRRLLDLAFPAGRGAVRSIVATFDVRAQARYYAAGTIARFPLYTLAGRPAVSDPAADLDVVPIDTPQTIQHQRAVERQVLGHQRSDDEVNWLLQYRRGHVYKRDDQAIGFSFVGPDGVGPAAALDPSDLAAILLHVEHQAHDLGLNHIEIQVPAPNAAAMRHLLSRGYQVDPWMNFLMSDRPFGHFDRFINFSPPLFL